MGEDKLASDTEVTCSMTVIERILLWSNSPQDLLRRIQAPDRYAHGVTSNIILGLKFFISATPQCSAVSEEATNGSRYNLVLGGRR